MTCRWRTMHLLMDCMKRCCTPGVFPSPSPSIPANGWSRAPMFWRFRFTTRTPILRTSLPAHFWHWLGLRRHRFPLVSFPIGGSLLPPEYHTNFKLKPGEPVILSNASGSLLDLASLPTELRAGVTMGRAEGASDWCFFTSPSPGSANLSSCLSHVAPAPVVEPASGWYAASTVTASPGQPSGASRADFASCDPALHGGRFRAHPFLQCVYRLLESSGDICSEHQGFWRRDGTQRNGGPHLLPR